MINTFVALLVEFDLLTAEEGESLAEKIRNATLPQDYASAQRQVREFIKDVKEGK